MKLIKNSLILLFIIGCLSSCTSGHYFGDEIKLEAPRLVYVKVNRTIESYIETFDFARKIDAYLQSDGAKRDSLKYYTLTGYDILERHDSVFVKHADGEEWQIYRASTDSLTSEGVEWNVVKYKSINYGGDPWYSGVESIESNSFRIKNQVNNSQWSIKIENYGFGAISNASINIKLLPSLDPNKWGSYSVTTDEGTVNEVKAYPGLDMFVASYNIIEPLIYKKINSYPLVRGEIDIDLHRGANAEVDNIRVKVLPFGAIQVTFKGYTGICMGY